MERIINVLRLNAYMPMKTNLKNIIMFFKNNEDKMDIIAFVDNTKDVQYGSEQMSDITFQIERKFLLKGKRNVNIQYVVITDNIVRDKEIGEAEKISFWLYDIYTSKIIAYENSLDEFDDLREQIESELMKMRQPDTAEKSSGLISFTLVNTILLLLNILIFVIMENKRSSLGEAAFVVYGGCEWRSIYYGGEYYRLLTAMFIHFGFDHLLSNMICLFVLGPEVEKIYGKIRYLLIYLISGIGAGVVSSLYYMNEGKLVYSAGASGAIYGIIGAMLVGLYFEKKIDGAHVMGRILMMILMVVFSEQINVDVDYIAHLGGLVVGFMSSALVSYIQYNRAKSS